MFPSDRTPRPARALPILLVPLLVGGLGGCSKDSGPGPGGGAGSPNEATSAPEGGSSPAARTSSALLAFQKGTDLQVRGELAMAEAELERAVELDGSLSEAYFQLGKLRVGLSSRNVGSTVREPETLAKGLAALARAAELEPSNDEYAYWLGRARHIAKDLPGAREALERATELNAGNAEAWKRLGMVHLDEAHLEQARDAFQAAVAIDPPEAGALFQLGQTLELLEDLDGARAAYQRSIEADRTNAGPYGALAKLLAKQGDEAGAAEAETQHEYWKGYEEKLSRRMVAAKQQPDDAATLRRLAEMFLIAEKWGEAADWSLKSINIDSSDHLAHLYRGVALRHLGELDASLPHLKEAEFLGPEYIEPKLELLRLYGDQQDASAFAELLATVEEAAAADGLSLHDLAVVCREYGREEDAGRLSGKARALGVTGD
jgi:predicted Zn-dependent protease